MGLASIIFKLLYAAVVFAGAAEHSMNNTVTDYRIISKSRPNAGIVEVYTQELGWGLICNGNQIIRLAEKVCFHLHFPGAARDLSASDFDDDNDGWPLSRLTRSQRNFSCSYDEEEDVTCTLASPSSDCFVTAVKAVTCKDPGYLGCFNDKDRFFSDRTRAINDDMVDMPQRNSPESCVRRCKEGNYSYAGVEYEYECFCGAADADYGRHGKVSDGECADMCPGDSKESCGDSDKIGIYEVTLGFCHEPKAPENGQRTGDWFRYGAVVTFHCNEGFILEGIDSIQCLQHGNMSRHDVTWNGQVPSCIEKYNTTSLQTTIITRTTVNTDQRGSSASRWSTASLQSHKQGYLTENGNVLLIAVCSCSAFIVTVIAFGLAVFCRRRTRRLKAKDRRSSLPLVHTYHALNKSNRTDDQLHDDVTQTSTLIQHADHPNTEENAYLDKSGGQAAAPQPDPNVKPSEDTTEYCAIPKDENGDADPTSSTAQETTPPSSNDVYANADFHEVPANLVENEMYLSYEEKITSNSSSIL